MGPRDAEYGDSADSGRSPYPPGRPRHPADDWDDWPPEEQRRPPPGSSRPRHEHTPRPRARPRQWWRVAIPVTVSVVGISLLFPAGRHEWALSLFHQQARYTALSFNNPSGLPIVATEHAPMTVSFTIANREGRTLRYRYVVSANGNGISRTLATAVRTLPDGGSWTVTAAIKPVCPTSAPCQIEVALPGHAPHIDFYVTLIPARHR